MDTNTTRKHRPDHNHPPKLLPWLAHKAGIGDARAEILWRTADRHAALTAGERGSHAHSQAALKRLRELIAAESLREDAASFGLRCWSRLNACLWQTPVALFDVASLSVTRGWRIVGSSSRPC